MLTDNEIIKALECCFKHDSWEECSDCAYKSIAGICIDCLIHDALDLINRQKAEIEKKDTEIDILIRKKETLRDEISELQRKNNELEIELEEMCLWDNLHNTNDTIPTIFSEELLNACKVNLEQTFPNIPKEHGEEVEFRTFSKLPAIGEEGNGNA